MSGAMKAIVAGLTSLLRHLIEWLAERDPAFSRMRLASRAMLSLALTVVLLIGVNLLHPLPFAAFGLSFVIAFSGTLAVRDKTPMAQLETRAWAWVGAVAAVTAAGLLSKMLLAADLAYLLLIFVAVYARSFGQRWTAVGMITVMAYFIGDYLAAPPSGIGWIALAAALGLLVTHLVTNVVLADNPERDFRRALLTVEQRVDGIVRSAGDGSVAPRRLRHRLAGLREIVLAAEGFIPQGEGGALAARGAASDLAIALFDVQLAAERFARSADDGSRAADLQRVGDTKARLRQVLGPSPSPAFAIDAAPVPPKSQRASLLPTRGIIPPALHQPIQVTIACAVAMAAGTLVSPSRWYWAVITAFIVFNNTKSRADTAVRALQRSGGTLAGLIGGTVLATLLHGRILASGVLLPVCFFFAFYFVQASYSTMIFFITLALALLYGLMGSFSPDVLVLRLVETIIGSLAGTVSAFVIFPARTSTGVEMALGAYLNALDDFTAAVRSRAQGEPEPLHLLGRSRLLDRSYGDLAAAVRPLGGAWTVVTRFGAVRQKLLLLSAVAHWARVLARRLPSGTVVDPVATKRIGALVDAISSRADAIRREGAAFFARPARAPGTPISPSSAREHEPVSVLETMAALLDRAGEGTSGQ